MAEEKLIEAVERSEDAAARVLYKITDSGKEEFMCLLRKQWWETKPSIDPFQVPLTFMNFMPKDELLLALETKSEHLKVMINAYERGIPMKMADPKIPRHINDFD